ncbi:MAG: DUF559 domain-containing protein, partial [Candidatus Methylomirabilales bacterium]
MSFPRANPMLTRWWTLSQHPTKHEQLLEPALASLGRPYRHCPPVRAGKLLTFPDFVLTLDWLVVEVDGPSHKKTQVKDEERTQALK